MSETIKDYELRELNAKDIFPMFVIIKKIGVNEVKSVFGSPTIKDLIEKGQGNAEAIGIAIAMELAGLIIEHVPDAEAEIFAFLGNVSGMKKKDLELLPMPTFMQMIVDIVKKDEFKDFIKVVSTLFK